MKYDKHVKHSINVPQNSDNIIIKNIINKLTNSKIDFSLSEEVKELVNNPNFLMLLYNIVRQIKIEELNTEDREFTFSLLLNIHSRLFFALKLWTSDLKLDIERIREVIVLIEHQLKWFEWEFEWLITTLDTLLKWLQEEYYRLIDERNDDKDILISLILEYINKINNIELSLLEEDNLSFLWTLILNFKLRLESILDTSNDNTWLQLMIRDKLKSLNKFFQITNGIVENKDSKENNRILLDNLIILIEKFEKSKKNEKDSVMFDNYFTEALLSTLEKLPDNNVVGNLKEQLNYMLLNILTSREFAMYSPWNNKNPFYTNDKINQNYINRSEKQYDRFKT